MCANYGWGVISKKLGRSGGGGGGRFENLLNFIKMAAHPPTPQSQVIND